MNAKDRIIQYIKKYKSFPVQMKASIWYTICNFLQKGISFIVIPIYVRVLTVEEYGVYTVFQSWRDILIIFATLNLYCGVFTKAMIDYEKDRDRYISCMQMLSTILTINFFLVYLLGRNKWNILFGMDTITMFFMFLYFMFYPSFLFWSVRQKVEYKYIRMIFTTLLLTVVTPAISLFMLYFTNLREYSVIWGYLFVQSVIGFILYIFQFIKGRALYIKKYWVSALKFNIPLIPHYLSLMILGQSDRIMIEKICGSSKAGIYSLSYQISILMNILINAINGTLVPWSYEQLKLRNYKKLKNISNFLCIVMSILTFCIILIAPEIIKIIGTEEYYSAVWIVPAVAVGVYFTFCYNLFSTVEFYFGDTKFVMIASLIGAILNFGLNAIFIPIYGFIAAGYTTMFCYLIFMLMHYMFMKKVCNKYKLKEQIYDINFIIITCIILISMSAVVMALYRKYIIRYICIIIIIIFIYIKRKTIINNLKIIMQ